MPFQKTLDQEVQAVGVGLHSGNPIQMKLKPAPPNTGLVFIRTDLDGASVKACPKHIDFNALQMATTLRKDKVLIQTTEHLLSAFYASGIDNAFIELDGPEVPIMDGSATPFLVIIEEAGIKTQKVQRTYLKIEKSFRFEWEGKSLEVSPSNEFRISYAIDFDHPLIRQQEKTVTVDDHLFEAEIAPARTFGFLKDVNYLKSKGLIRGGSLDNAVVLDGDRILNESLRLHDEFVSHKILDLIGDLAVGGYRFRGHFKANRAGHEVHARFLKALLENPQCYSLTYESEPQPQTAASSVTEALAGASL